MAYDTTVSCFGCTFSSGFESARDSLANALVSALTEAGLQGASLVPFVQASERIQHTLDTYLYIQTPRHIRLRHG